MPDLPRSVVSVQAFTAIASSGGVVFMDNTPTVLERYAIHSRKRAIRLVHLPISDPEVELPVLRCSAGNGLADGRYEEQNHESEEFHALSPKEWFSLRLRGRNPALTVLVGVELRDRPLVARVARLTDMERWLDEPAVIGSIKGPG